MKIEVRLAALALAGLVAANTVPAQTFRVENPGPIPAVGFGASLAISGQDVFVARAGVAIGFPVPAGQRGAVHVYRRGEQGWSEVAAVSAARVGGADAFGSSLSVDGPLMAVGAPLTNGGRGAVYVFERDAGGRWHERARLEGAEAGNRFGASVAIAGQALLVGSPGASQGTGTVVTYRRGANSAAWTESSRLAPAGLTQGDAFGAALAVSGDAVLVGAPGLQSGLFTPVRGRAGQAFIFRRDGAGAWAEEAKLSVTADARPYALGTAIALSGDDAYLGHPMADQAQGVIHHFRREGGNWTYGGRITAAAPVRPSYFGASLAVRGNTMIVGAPATEHGGGAVHFLSRDASGAWSGSATQVMTAEAVGIGTQLGGTVAIGDAIALGGAPSADFFEGRAILYTRGADGRFSETTTLVDETPAEVAEVRGSAEVHCGAGKAGEFPCQQVDLVSFLPVKSLGGKRGIMVNDLWGWTDSTTGREFAIVGRFDGTVFVEVTDPANPVYLGELPLHAGAKPNLWRDIKVYRNHAYIVADGAGPHGIQVFDLTQLRNVQGAPKTFSETAHYDQIASAHNIAIDETSGFAYTIGNSMGGTTCGGGPHMIDIREPASPKFAGCWADTTTGSARTGYTHDSQCTVYRGPDERYRGRQLCFNASETALGIADVTDKANPKRISSASYPNVAYAHQGWLSADHRYFFLNDEGDEIAGTAPKTRTLVFDVTDLEDPVVAREFFGTTEASDHNLYVKDRYMYQSNYVSGLRVIDVSDPANPVEVGFFDTMPFGPDQAGYAGSWSNYPYFKSGVVAVTSMREGLFLVRFRPQQVVP